MTSLLKRAQTRIAQRTKTFADLARDVSAVAMIEVAFCVPILAMIGFGGIEYANLLLSGTRVNQIGLSAADNAARIAFGSNLSQPRVREVDINEVFAGVEEQSKGMNFKANGRVILSSIERNPDGGQWIHWQRCYGDLPVIVRLSARKARGRREQASRVSGPPHRPVPRSCWSRSPTTINPCCGANGSRQSGSVKPPPSLSARHATCMAIMAPACSIRHRPSLPHFAPDRATRHSITVYYAAPRLLHAPLPMTTTHPPDTQLRGFVALLPAAARPYALLARFDRPIGWWLLYWPCAWGVALGGGAVSHWPLFLWLLLGAIAMRGAGCVYNDIVDRDLDAKVARTASRPIASGAVSVRNAALWAVLLSLVGLLVLLQLPWPAQIVALASLILVAGYPFMKRITWWPQAWLGLVFSWGALVAWVAVGGDANSGEGGSRYRCSTRAASRG